MINDLRIVPRFNCDFPLSYALSAAWPPRSQGVRPQLRWSEAFGSGERGYWLDSGRLALCTALRALFPAGGKRVGVQAFTCRVVFEAIRQSGNRAIFLDVADDYTLCLQHLATRISELDAVILTHTFGTPARIREVLDLAGGTPVIEDCAHSLFSEYHGAPTGSFGAAAFFSFGFGKPVSLGGGGLLQVNDPTLVFDADTVVANLPFHSPGGEVSHLIKCLACALAHRRVLYGILTLRFLKPANHAFDLTGDGDFTQALGMRTSERILAAKWKDFRRVAETRRGFASHLAHRLDGRFGCCWAQAEARGRSNAYLYPLRAADPVTIIQSMGKHGFEGARHFHAALEHARDYGYIDGDCPITELLVQELFTVPVHQGMTSAQVERLGDLLVSLAPAGSRLPRVPEGATRPCPELSELQ